ncbi:NAD(P)-binding protein [Hypomontagnella monticulosa]|nr:NAD(P)-binding protein [Hypomontagnella monticulosa]
MSAQGKRTVLITGCSDGGMGAGLAVAFHEAGLHVIATARDPSKMAGLAALGIETLPLDVLSESSIAACVGKLSSLDILVNNAGAQRVMPLVDMSLSDAKELFDVNVWAHVALIQAFMPLLMKSRNGAMIVNNTSAACNVPIPFQAVYNASKAALSMLSNTLRLELQGFDIKVIDLKSGIVKTNILTNMREAHLSLPEGSIYEPAREVMERALRADTVGDRGTPPVEWGRQVVADLLKKNPPPIVWRGEMSWIGWVIQLLPFGTLDGYLKKAIGVDVVERIIQVTRS